MVRKKAVLLASSHQGVESTDKCQRWSKIAKEFIDVDRPAIVKQYNTDMGGVDLSDMLLSLYRINIRPKRWYIRILYYFIDLSIVNSWLLYRRHMEQHGKNRFTPLLEFRADIAESLIKAGKPTIERRRGRPSLQNENQPEAKQRRFLVKNPPVVVRFDRIDHFPEHAEKRGRCRLCSKGYSQMKCVKCGILLCFTKDKNCFKDYHVQ